MRKILVLLLVAVLVLGTAVSVSANEDIKLTPDKITDKYLVNTDGGVVRNLTRKAYFSFPGVDMTGINSVSVRAKNDIDGTSNAMTLAVVLDDPKKGEVLGYINLSEPGEDINAYAPIKRAEGTHNVYFYCYYGSVGAGDVAIKEIGFSKAEHNRNTTENKVSDDYIKDIYSDTWAGTDSLGRRVADYAEAGDVKTDGRTVGMFYWNWHVSDAKSARATVISDVIKAHPEAKEDYKNEAWDQKGVYYWDEPVLGFYTSEDYFVYRRHAQMLADAGVDMVFLDYSNTHTYIPELDAMVDAFRDAKKSGVNIPRISAMTLHLKGDGKKQFENLASIYFNCFVENDYTDVWAYWDGKPLLYANSTPDAALANVDGDNEQEKKLLDDIKGFFTFREQGTRDSDNDGKLNDGKWMWLENFPQVLRNPDETGRPECVSVGVSINHSYVYGYSAIGVASDPHTKGRGYSEVFGEDYSENGARMAYFFSEQAALALTAEPKIVMIDGWNEWTADRKAIYSGFKNSFVDCYTPEDSRDFEPSRGILGDDYYMLLIDFVRKYKGVRPVPVATGAKTIDLSGPAEQWDGVGPEFLNDDETYERDFDGRAKAKNIVGDKMEPWHYKTTVNNAVKSAKVSFDNENIYILIKTFNPIVSDRENFLHIFIDTDRNRATGWEGYDYSINVSGKGAVSTYSDGWKKIADAEYNLGSDSYTVKIPRNLIGETGTVDMEFKVTDSVAADDILDFYSDGSSAPIGRLNWVYTEKAEKTLGQKERNALLNTAVVKAGCEKMAVGGAVMTVYEKDRRVTPFLMNGTLYVPETAYNEIMGYGRSKTEYMSDYNMFFTYHYELSDDLGEIINYNWTNGVLGSGEIYVNGRLKWLSAPVLAKDGIIFVPLSLIEECYGKRVTDLGGGSFAVSGGEYDESAVLSALSLCEEEAK